MQQLEGFQYATALYFNMGYYNIRPSPDIQYMTNIVTKFGKLRYNRLPMYMCTSVDTLQAKIYKILADISGVKTYIDDI